MLRFFQKLVDPFQPDGNTQPPASVWDYLVHNLRPFGWIIAVSLVFTVLNAGIEVWLIGYAGTLVDTLAASSPERSGPPAAPSCCSLRSSSSWRGR